MTVRQAATLMRGWSIGCLPVVDGQGLVGIVTVSDLLGLIARGEARVPVRNGGKPPKRPSG
jgi:predicted transcriptional regulator